MRSRDDLRGFEHPVEVARLATGACLLAMTPQGNLRDRDPDQDEQHRYLDVIGVGDGELSVWLGQEYIEPHAGRQRRDDPRIPVTGGRRRDDDKDQHQGGRRRGETFPESREPSGTQQRRNRRSCDQE